MSSMTRPGTRTAHIEDAERGYYELAKSAGYKARLPEVLAGVGGRGRSRGEGVPQRDGKLSGISTGMRDLDTKMGGLPAAPTSSSWPDAGHGQDVAGDRHRRNMANVAELLQADGAMKAANGGVIGFFSVNVGRPAAPPAPRGRARRPLLLPHRPAAGISEADFDKIREFELQSAPSMRTRDRRPQIAPLVRAR